MTIIPFYGVAIHALLPYLKHRNENSPSKTLNFPKGIGRKFFLVLHKHAPGIPLGTLREWSSGNHPRLRIIAAWQYLIDTFQDYDEVWLEPEIVDGVKLLTVPDFVLRRGTVVVVADIKAWVNPALANRNKLNRQVKTTAKILQQHYGETFQIQGRGLIFHNDSSLPFEASWTSVDLTN